MSTTVFAGMRTDRWHLAFYKHEYHFSDIGIACVHVCCNIWKTQIVCVRRWQKIVIVCIQFTNEAVAARDARERRIRPWEWIHTTHQPIKKSREMDDMLCITKNGFTLWRQVESQNGYVEKVTPLIHKCGLHNPCFSTLLFPFYFLPFFFFQVYYHGYRGTDPLRNSIRALSKTSPMHLAWLWKAFQYVLFPFSSWQLFKLLNCWLELMYR